MIKKAVTLKIQINRRVVVLVGIMLIGALFYVKLTNLTDSPIVNSLNVKMSGDERRRTNDLAFSDHDAAVRKTNRDLIQNANSIPAAKFDRKYSLLSGSSLSFAARRELGLSDDQCNEVNKIVRGIKSDVQSEMVNRIKRDPVFDRPDRKGIAYSIEAFPDISEEIIQRAKYDLEKTVGDLGGEIISEIEQSSVFLGNGKNDVMFNLNPEVVQEAFDESGTPRENWVVTFFLLDPQTGKRKSGGAINFSKFNEEFMNLFEFHDKN